MPDLRDAAVGNAQGDGAGVFRALLQFLRSAVGHDLAAIDDDRARTRRLDLLQNVGGKNDRLRFAHLPNQRANLVLLVWIEAIGRLIEHEHFRIVDDRLRETGAMPIALRQRLDALVDNRLEKTHFDHALDGALVGLSA